MAARCHFEPISTNIHSDPPNTTRLEGADEGDAGRDITDTVAWRFLPLRSGDAGRVTAVGVNLPSGSGSNRLGTAEARDAGRDTAGVVACGL